VENGGAGQKVWGLAPPPGLESPLLIIDDDDDDDR